VTALREAARSCAARQGISGSIGLLIDIDAAGTATAARDDAGGDLGSCITGALVNVQFPASQRAARLQLRLAL
jgi:hypothetical protein